MKSSKNKSLQRGNEGERRKEERVWQIGEKKVWGVLLSKTSLCAPPRHPDTSHLSPLTPSAWIRHSSALPHTPHVCVWYLKWCALCECLCFLCRGVCRVCACMCFSLLRVYLFVCLCDWYMHWAALHSTPRGSIKSYSCCKSDGFLFTTKPSNCRMWLLYNAHGRFMLPRKVIRSKKSKALFTTQLVMIFFSLWGWIDEQSRPSTSLLFNHLCDYREWFMLCATEE